MPNTAAIAAAKVMRMSIWNPLPYEAGVQLYTFAARNRMATPIGALIRAVTHDDLWTADILCGVRTRRCYAGAGRGRGDRPIARAWAERRAGLHRRFHGGRSTVVCDRGHRPRGTRPYRRNAVRRHQVDRRSLSTLPRVEAVDGAGGQRRGRG